LGNITDNCLEFATALGLAPDADGLFIGKVGGFPVGLKFIDPAGSCLFLFQIRHWLTQDAPQLKALAYNVRISQLLADKTIEIEFDDRLAWLTILNVDRCLTDGPMSEILESVLNTFRTAGLIGDPQLCHYCQKENVSSLSTSEGKVAQICSLCLSERQKKKERETAAPAGDAVPIFLMSPFASLAGALLWAGCWFYYGRFIESFHSDTVVMPYYLIGLIVIFIAGVVGAPVGWIIRQNRRRGNVSAASAAILFGSLAVICGELIHLAWLIWKWHGVFSISVAAQVLPDYYRGNDGFFLGMKFIAALFSVLLAYEMSKPKQAKLKL
jgi:hypothetical protein